MKEIAGRRLLPEVNFLTVCSRSEETTIGGKGEPHGLIATQEIQEKPRTPGIPHYNFFLEDEGKPRESRNKQTLS